MMRILVACSSMIFSLIANSNSDNFDFSLPYIKKDKSILKFVFLNGINTTTISTETSVKILESAILEIVKEFRSEIC